MSYPGISKTSCADVVITAGGTKEYIDDVRYIGNFSSGGFGHALAQEFSDYDRFVTLVSPRETMDRYGKLPNITHQEFTNTASLEQNLRSIGVARIVLQSAAVSDYTPARHNGKLSSDNQSLIMELTRTPKILAGLREHFGNSTYIVGFKLLSGVSHEKLIDTGKQQIITNRTDMCVANDLSDIHGGTRRIHVINGREASVTTLEGPTQQVARHLASMILVAADAKEQSND